MKNQRVINNDYFIFFLLIVLIPVYVHTLNTNLTANIQIRSQCEMLNIVNFYLDISCVKAEIHAPVIRISTSSPDSCRTQCCKYHEGSCDMLYWDSYHSCILMDFSVLNSCSVNYGSNIRSYFSTKLSLEVPDHFKKLLLVHGYRNYIHSHFGCGEDKYLCNDWSCRDEKCDCVPNDDCHSETNQNKKCFGDNGQWYEVGEQYVPYGEADKCKTCSCGSSGRPSYCSSATCHLTSADACHTRPHDICCTCLGINYFNNTHPDEDFMSSSKRLIVSAVFVLMVIIVLLFFSKSVRSPSTGNGVANSQPRRGLRWLLFSSNNSSDSSWQGRYSSQSDSMCFFDENGLPIELEDRPPPYNAVKWSPPPSVESQSPPSYRSSICSQDTSSAGETLGTSPPDLSNNCQQSETIST